MPVPRRPRRAAAALIASMVAAAAGGILWWQHGDDPDRDCTGLRTDQRIRTVLGAAHRDGMSCGELADGLRHAVGAGTPPGSRTREQADAMRTVVLALADRPDHRVHPDLRRPLAAALAEYAADTHEVLTRTNDRYRQHDGASGGAWQDEQGVHVAVEHGRLLAALRGLCADPQAYAELRGADLRRGAADLAAVPGGPAAAEPAGASAGTGAGTGTAEAALVAPLVRTAAAAGAYDGLAQDVLRGLGDDRRAGWRDEVLRHLADPDQPPPPAFAVDGPAHLARTWLHGVTRGDADGTARFARLDDQAAGLLAAWAAVPHTLPAGTDLRTLQERARDTTGRERAETVKELSAGGS